MKDFVSYHRPDCACQKCKKAEIVWETPHGTHVFSSLAVEEWNEKAEEYSKYPLYPESTGGAGDWRKIGDET